MVVGFVVRITGGTRVGVVMVVAVCDVASGCNFVKVFHESVLLSAELPNNLLVDAPVDFLTNVRRPFKFLFDVFKIRREKNSFAYACFVVAVDGVALYDKLGVGCREHRY
jgi:hypothetical protein